MIRGVLLFYCRECDNRFIGRDIEFGATIFPVPLECPRCGSSRTRPWSLLPSKLADKQYKSIWEVCDKFKR